MHQRRRKSPLETPVRALALLAGLVVLGLRPAHSVAGAKNTVFEIPRLDSIAVDGGDEDWGSRGFRVEQVSFEGEAPTPQDFDVRFRLGWDDRGLLVLLEERRPGIRDRVSGADLGGGLSLR